LKTTEYFITVAVAFCLACCCHPSLNGSGKLASKEQQFSGFNKVEAGNAFTVALRQADHFKVIVHIDDNLVKHLRLSQSEQTLKIRMNSKYSYSVGDESMRVEISMPHLAGLDLSGASQAHVSGFNSTNDLEVELSGASSVTGDLTAKKVKLDMSGASSIELRGSADYMTLDASGASHAKLVDFALSGSAVDLSGASQAEVSVSSKLDISASGASRLAYSGNPLIGSLDTSGASSIDKI
jgi:putative autotransporter adhesin-like protein